MNRVFLSHVDGEFLVSTPDGMDDALADALDSSLGQYTMRNDTRLGLLERYANHVETEGEDWKAAWLDPPNAIRKRVRSHVETAYDIEIVTEKNRNWGTRCVKRETGPVDHYMLLFTTLRSVFQSLIDAGVRQKRSQNPFEKDGWHEDSDQEKWLYCVRRYGNKAARMFPYAGAYFLPMGRRPYHRSLFNPAGVGRRMAEAIRERSGDHVATNIIEIIGTSDPVRPDDLMPASAADWPDCGDLIYSRNKGDGDEHHKPTAVGPEALANLHRRIDLDHAADPKNRPSVAMLKEWWANEEMEKLHAFKIFQKHPSKGVGIPTYNSVWQLLRKACIRHDVTVGRGAAKRYASLRWARRERVDARMLDAHRSSRTMAELEMANKRLQTDMGWRTDQTPNYGSHAAQVVSVERKRELIEKDVKRQEAEARGEKVHVRAKTSPAVIEADAVAMTRPRR